MNGLLTNVTPLETEDDSDGLSALVGLDRDTLGVASQRTKRSSFKPWLRVQALNVTRHAAALRPFSQDEFGTDPASPSDAHIDAVNELIVSLREQLMEMSRKVGMSAQAAMHEPNTKHLQQLMARKDQAHNWVRAIEQIWDFYFELFGQRQTQFGNWLLGCDRIALDCYQDIYMGLGIAKSIPAPAPFSYMRTGFSPATFRRGIPSSQGDLDTILAMARTMLASGPHIK